MRARLAATLRRLAARLAPEDRGADRAATLARRQACDHPGEPRRDHEGIWRCALCGQPLTLYRRPRQRAQA